MFDKMVMGKFYRNAKTAADVPWHREEPEEFVQNVIKKLDKRGRALDIGCGTGAMSVYLAKQGFEVTGLDYFARALEMGQAHAKRENVSVNWVEADLFTWQPPQKFDLVFDSGCLHALVGGNAQKYKDQLVKWLAPGGNYILGHWGKKHSFDWLPIGPRRRSHKQILRLLGPELKEIESHHEIMTGIPKPFGPTIMGMGFWFKGT